MFNTIRDIFAPKVGIHAILRGFISNDAGATLRAIVSTAGLKGWMRIVGGGYAVLELEGPRPKIETLIYQLQHTTLSAQPMVLEITWRPAKNQFHNFHVAL